MSVAAKKSGARMVAQLFSLAIVGTAVVSILGPVLIARLDIGAQHWFSKTFWLVLIALMLIAPVSRYLMPYVARDLIGAGAARQNGTAFLFAIFPVAPIMFAAIYTTASLGYGTLYGDSQSVLSMVTQGVSGLLAVLLVYSFNWNPKDDDFR